jgi:hypothetical protein
MALHTRFLTVPFGDVDMEEADRIALEFGPRCFFAFRFGQTADAMTLQATVEG